jgi:hypothetical protein
MPPWRRALTEEEIEAIWAYIGAIVDLAVFDHLARSGPSLAAYYEIGWRYGSVRSRERLRVSSGRAAASTQIESRLAFFRDVRVGCASAFDDLTSLYAPRSDEARVARLATRRN